MKTNQAYIRNMILNEVLMVYTTYDVATKMTEYLSERGIDLYIYETHDDGIMFRQKKDNNVTDNLIVSAFVHGIKTLIKDSDETSNSIVEAINDNYDFEYRTDYLTDSFGEDTLTIRHNGRIVSLEIDL